MKPDLVMKVCCRKHDESASTAGDGNCCPLAVVETMRRMGRHESVSGYSLKNAADLLRAKTVGILRTNPFLNKLLSDGAMVTWETLKASAFDMGELNDAEDALSVATQLLSKLAEGELCHVIVTVFELVNIAVFFYLSSFLASSTSWPLPCCYHQDHICFDRPLNLPCNCFLPTCRPYLVLRSAAQGPGNSVAARHSGGCSKCSPEGVFQGGHASVLE